jgi:hypothetical protein
MGWFGADKSIEATGNVIEKTGKALGGLFTSDDERLTHKEVYERIKQKPQEWAHELNLADANSGSWFNSGWRPMLGWVGGISLALFFIPQYLMGAGLWGFQCFHVISEAKDLAAIQLPVYPVSSDAVMELVMFLFGAGAIRSFDKLNGNAKS